MTTFTRREFAAALGLVPVSGAQAPAKPMRGIFIIMATPYTATKDVDFEDLAREVDFLDHCGVQGMVWPQLASEYTELSKPERLRGMEVLAKAASGKKPALVLGIQGPNTAEALEYARHAEKLGPDAVIAIPPAEARSLGDFREYYRALARATQRPFFIQTTGGAKGLTPPVEFLVEMAREFPHLGYVKEEASPVIERMLALARQRPPIKSIFSGNAGRGLLFELRLGMDGTMPGAPYADVYARIWEEWQRKREDRAREVFSKLLLMINLDQQIPGVRPYIMRKRGVFKTAVSRQRDFQFTPEAVREIEFNFAALKPYLRA
ncbi:MAG: dihydrodipicolinate synthase family protein [Acidobacteriota bacterium]